MNKELVYVFCVAFIIVLFGHQYTAIADQQSPIDQEAQRPLTVPAINESEFRPVEQNITPTQPHPQTSTNFVAQEAEKQNEDPWDLARGVPINEYMNPKV